MWDPIILGRLHGSSSINRESGPKLFLSKGTRGGGYMRWRAPQIRETGQMYRVLVVLLQCTARTVMEAQASKPTTFAPVFVSVEGHFQAMRGGGEVLMRSLLLVLSSEFRPGFVHSSIRPGSQSPGLLIGGVLLRTPYSLNPGRGESHNHRHAHGPWIT